MQDRPVIPTYHFDQLKPCYCNSGKNFGECCGDKSENRRLPDGLFIVNNFISKAECNNFLRFAEKQSRSWLLINAPEKSTDKKIAGKRDPGRVTQQVQLGKKTSLAKEWLRKACVEHVQKSLNMRPQWFEDPQLLRYGVGGKYDRHADAEEFDPKTGLHYRVVDRDFSLLVYLNDDYEGGGLKFSGLDFHYQPVAGDLVFFPSNHLFTHESLPIISGKKYALVCWGALHGIKRLYQTPPYGVVYI